MSRNVNRLREQAGKEDFKTEVDGSFSLPGTVERKTETETSEEARAEVVSAEELIQMCLISEIRLNPSQPRKYMDPGALEELANSIREQGVLEPIIVRVKDGHYELVAGSRRLEASKMAGKTEIPCIVKEMDDNGAFILTLTENIQRNDLSPMEEALAYDNAINNKKVVKSARELAERLGVSESRISQKRMLLDLDPAIKDYMLEHPAAVSETHGVMLAGVRRKSLQKELFFRCAEEGWSSRKLKSEMEKALSGRDGKEQEVLFDTDYYRVKPTRNGLNITIKSREKLVPALKELLSKARSGQM